MGIAGNRASSCLSHFCHMLHTLFLPSNTLKLSKDRAQSHCLVTNNVGTLVMTGDLNQTVDGLLLNKILQCVNIVEKRSKKAPGHKHKDVSHAHPVCPCGRGSQIPNLNDTQALGQWGWNCWHSSLCNHKELAEGHGSSRIWWFEQDSTRGGASLHETHQNIGKFPWRQESCQS